MEKAFHSAVRADDDEKLIVQVAQGDRSAFGQLYDRFSTPLYSLALKMLANEAEAQDLLQEVFPLGLEQGRRLIAPIAAPLFPGW